MPIHPEQRAAVLEALNNSSAVSQETIVELTAALDRRAQPSWSPYLTTPTTLCDALHSHVCPQFLATRLPLFPGPNSTESIDLADLIPQGHEIRVQFSQGVTSTLSTTLRESIASSPPSTSEGQANLDMFLRTTESSIELVNKAPLAYEDDQSALALATLAMPLNAVLADTTTYAAGKVLASTPRWVRARQEGDRGVTDWVCVTGNNRDELVSKAVNEWMTHGVLSNAQLSGLRRVAALGNSGFSFAATAAPGSTTLSPTPVLPHPQLHPNALKGTLQVWVQLHRYQCRWGLLYNTSTMAVFFLASPYRLLMGDLIEREDGRFLPVLTVAGALVATAIATEIPDGADKAITFLRFGSEDASGAVSQSVSGQQSLPRSSTPAPLPVQHSRHGVPTITEQTVDFDTWFAITAHIPAPAILCRQFHPASLPSSNPDTEPVLRLGAMRGSGSVWTTFAATLNGTFDSLRAGFRVELDPTAWPHLPTDLHATEPALVAGNMSVIVKACIPSYNCPPETTPVKLLERISNEDAMYRGPLADLHQVVPTYAGLFRRAGAAGDAVDSLWLSVMEDVGSAIAHEWQDVHDLDRPHVLGLFDTIHARGVAHGDVEVRHVRFRHPDTFRLIDFDQASTDEERVVYEGVEIRRMLGFAA